MNILVTGETGYISSKLKKYLSIKNAHSKVVTKSVRNSSVEQLAFSKYDILIHPAALVHKRETPESEAKYFEVNTELTHQLALQAKKQGVKHFIFFSTMAVYGKGIGEINENSQLSPITFYGKSKLAAEKLLLDLEDDNFKVSIIRPPMVYGYECPGNYALLSKIAKKTFIFPKVNNKRSMIFIDNLLEFTSQIIENGDSGIFHPQDPQFINTSNMIETICKVNGKNIFLSKVGAKCMKLLIGKKSIYKKVFGDLYYSETLSQYKDNSYQISNLIEAIAVSEKGTK